MNNSRIFKWLLGAIIFLSFALRMYQVGRQSFWLDEMFSINVVMNPSLRSLFWDNHPFLYHLLLKIWTLASGFFEGPTRLLSVIISVMTTTYLGIWGKRTINPRFGLLIAFLHAVCPISILYAQETRMYALLELTSAWQMGSYWNYQEKSRSKKMLMASSICLALTHYTAIFIFFLEGLLFFLKNKKGPDRDFILTLFLGCSFILASYATSFSWQNLEWQKMKYAHEPASRWPWEAMLSFGFQSWSIFAGAILSLVGLTWLSFRKKIETHRLIEDFGLVCFGVFLIVFIISVATQRALFLPRYFIFLIPFWLVILGAIFEGYFDNTDWIKKLWPIPLLIFLYLLYPNVLQTYSVNKAPWRTLLQEVAKTERPVVFTTRTLAIQYPYLKIHDIPAHKLENTEDGYQNMLKELSKFKTLWIVENYFGGLTYLSNLKERMTSEGFKVEEVTRKDLNSEPLFALKISTPEPSPLELQGHKPNDGSGKPKNSKKKN